MPSCIYKHKQRIMNKAELLRNEAIGHGLCAEWQKRFSPQATDLEMIALFKEGIDFCIKNRYPSPMFIKQNFSDAILTEHGIYANKSVAVEDGLKWASGQYAVLGTSDINVTIKSGAVATIYVTDTAKITIATEGLSRVFVMMYHDSIADITNNGDLAVMCYKHGKDMEKSDKIVVTPGENATINNQQG